MLDPSILFGVGDTPTLPVMPPVMLGVSSPLPTAPGYRIEEGNSDDQELARLLSAVVELQSALDEVSDLDQAGRRVTEMIGEHLLAKRCFLLWRPTPGQPLRMIGDSCANILADSQLLVRMLVAAGEEVVVRDAITRWPAEHPIERHALLAVVQLNQHLSAASLQAIRLQDESGNDRGVLMVTEPSPRVSDRFLRLVSVPLTSSLARIARLQPSRVETILRGLSKFLSGKRRNVTIVVCVMLAIAMLFPMPYHVSASLELQPIERRFIAVPFDGPLQSANVKPGDVVAQGDLLASINPREVEYEMAASQAQWNRAEQERKAMMAKHDFAGSKIAELESERLKIQSELLQYQRDNMEIRSPIEGVVVSGDLSQSEGMPMSRGEKLFEIAPLGSMVVEIAVPDSEVAEVRQGLDVQFFLNAFPSRKMSGEVRRIHPRAELREHENVFIAEVNLDDPEGLYRPGMHGRASITCDRHPLGWNLFHHAYFAACRSLGW